MNEIEAIEQLKMKRVLLERDYFSPTDYKEFDLAISALEKQVTKKPVVGEYDHMLEQIEVKCPSCSGMVGINNGEGIDIFFDYCSDCGQKLSKLEV
ncbi:MAG: hypothetical protein K0R54_2248 [Clostridiaceae bacterium]|jgi:hypothetical protein|nr:hypothetical protein [Clostridiaceae bacterium]